MNLKQIKMKISKKMKERVLRFVDNSWYACHNAGRVTNFWVEGQRTRMPFANYWQLVEDEFCKIKNAEDLLEVVRDTLLFRDEMEVLEHGFFCLSFLIIINLAQVF